LFLRDEELFHFRQLSHRSVKT